MHLCSSIVSLYLNFSELLFGCKFSTWLLSGTHRFKVKNKVIYVFPKECLKSHNIYMEKKNNEFKYIRVENMFPQCKRWHSAKLDDLFSLMQQLNNLSLWISTLVFVCVLSPSTLAPSTELRVHCWAVQAKQQAGGDPALTRRNVASFQRAEPCGNCSNRCKRRTSVGDKVDIIVGIQGSLDLEKHIGIRLPECSVDLKGLWEVGQMGKGSISGWETRENGDSAQQLRNEPASYSQ